MSSDNVEDRPEEPGKDERLEALAAQLRAGAAEWSCLTRKRLEIALHYGPVLIEWKDLVGHGSWQKSIREQVKGLDIRTCNRWKRIAEHKEQVEAALASWPDVGWGVVKMLDYLSGKFDPACPDEIDEEAEASVIAEQDHSAIGVGEAIDHEGEFTESDEEEEPSEGVTRPPALRFPTTPYFRADPKVSSQVPLKRKGGTKGRPKLSFVTTSKAAVAEVVGFEVEITKTLKVVVPKGVTDEQVRMAFVNNEVQFEISVDDEAWTLTDEGLPGIVKWVRPWD